MTGRVVSSSRRLTKRMQWAAQSGGRFAPPLMRDVSAARELGVTRTPIR